ncbi:MAG TPA: RHS repeat-associated core domain-containing protein, partial [Streptosporangiaceae bacterium]|nr:RHS repeat-associated core domain-containing protein [Streptosporangiaceae bacterium]
ATAGGGTGTVSNTYGYDEANRLTSWTATPSGGTAATKTYGYDNNGNLINNNGITQTYDARNELTSDSSGNSYTYTANGDMATQASPGNANYFFTSNAYGQQITDGFSSFAWDALDRVTSAGEAFNSSYSVALTYDGMTNQVASDPSATYSRDPAGQITGVDAALGGKTIALVNQHDDLSGTFAAAGTSLASSTTWDPWGQLLASTGPAIQVGYQGQWTDPITQQVSMGSRFYRPPLGGFINRDTYTGGQGGPAVTDDLHAYADDNPMSVTDPSGHAPSSSSGSGGGVTAGEIAAAAARAAAAHAKASAAASAAAAAAGAAVAASAAAHGAAALARLLNSAAAKAAQLAAKAEQLAAAAFKAAQAQLQTAREWQDKADAAWAAARDDLAKAHGWNLWKDAVEVKDAAVEAGIALYDETRAGAAMAAYLTLEATALGLQAAAEFADGMAQLAALAAKGAAKAADVAAKLADAAAHTAHVLAAVAAREEAIAAHDAALVAKLSAQYAKQMARKVAKAARAVARVVKKVAKKVAHAAVAVAKAAYKYSGAQDVVSCVTNPHLSSCVKAALTVALVVATAGEGEVEVAAMNAAEEGGADIAEQVGAKAAESCGLSFTANTKVLLANGKAVPISSLKPGEKVVSASTGTGKNQAETIAAVLINHDTDLYNLTIRAHGRTAVIHTTSNHPFWDVTAHRWVKAGTLRYGARLRTPAGGTATALGGHAPRHRSGWMWDLTIPGNHDFYINTTAADVLVHNCGSAPAMSQMERVGSGLKGDAFHRSTSWVVDNPAA